MIWTNCRLSTPRTHIDSPRGLRKCVSYLQMRAPRGAKAPPLDRDIRCVCRLRGISNPPSPVLWYDITHVYNPAISMKLKWHHITVFNQNKSAFKVGGLAVGVHPFSFRTRKLSPPAPMVLLRRESRSPPTLSADFFVSKLLRVRPTGAVQVV